MKISFWPHGLLFSLGTFVVGIVSVGYMFLQQDIGIVVKDYYQEEINFQQTLDDEKNALALPDPVKIDYDQAKERVVIYFPGFFEGRNIAGKVTFYRPSDGKLDKDLPLLLNDKLQQTIFTESFKKGSWIVKLKWTADGIGYYMKKKITIG